MPKVRVNNMCISLDGYSAGPNQSEENPLGERGEELHEFLMQTKRFGGPGASEADERFMTASMEGLGAWIMGRNMFGPVRGEWGDSDWKGWWGSEPPYHCPVFVLTHHPRPSIEMEGGTTFHFVTDGIEAALERAVAAAGDQDVRLGGGADTVKQYLRAGLVDEMHVAIVPVLLGAGEKLFEPIGDAVHAFDVAEVVSSPDSKVTHVRLVRR